MVQDTIPWTTSQRVHEDENPIILPRRSIHESGVVQSIWTA